MLLGVVVVLVMCKGSELDEAESLTRLCRKDLQGNCTCMSCPERVGIA